MKASVQKAGQAVGKSFVAGVLKETAKNYHHKIKKYTTKDGLKQLAKLAKTSPASLFKEVAGDVVSFTPKGVVAGLAGDLLKSAANAARKKGLKIPSGIDTVIDAGMMLKGKGNPNQLLKLMKSGKAFNSALKIAKSGKITPQKALKIVQKTNTALKNLPKKRSETNGKKQSFSGLNSIANAGKMMKGRGMPTRLQKLGKSGKAKRASKLGKFKKNPLQKGLKISRNTKTTIKPSSNGRKQGRGTGKLRGKTNPKPLLKALKSQKTSPQKGPTISRKTSTGIKPIPIKKPVARPTAKRPKSMPKRK